MARYGKEHKQATRQRIIDVAGGRLKRDGIHGSGIATLMADAGLTNGAFYAHFESISVQPGDLVDTGALLGKVGATGRVTGPHLHWGATVNRARANPLQLISLLGTNTQ